MLRITRTKSITLALLHLDGKLLGPWVEEVRSAVAQVNDADAVRLNLGGLRFADPEGIALLLELRRVGVELAGCSPLIAGLLAVHRPPTAAEQAPLHDPASRHEPAALLE